MPNQDIAVVIATVGRAEALRLCLQSLVAQTMRPAEVLVVHSGEDAGTRLLCEEDWAGRGLPVRYFAYPHRSAALQRDFGVRKTTRSLILFSDDDMEYTPGWVESLLAVLEGDEHIGAVMGAISNHQLPQPTPVWRCYRRLVARSPRAFLPGAVFGAGVHNGFPVGASEPIAAEWIGGCVTLLRKAAYLSVNGFAPYYRGSSPGEDVDLGYRISRKWRVYYVPAATCLHHQAGGGRDQVATYQHLYMRSRYAFSRVSAGRGAVAALAHVTLWALFQAASELGQLRRGRWPAGFVAGCYGRVTGAWSCIGWDPAREEFPAWHRDLVGQ